MKGFIFAFSFICFYALFAQWEGDVRLTTDPAISATSYNNAWCVAASGNTVHVVWYDYRDGGSPYGEIYYKRSTDGGTTWGADMRLTNDDSTSHFPSVAASGSFVHVVWVEARDGNSEIYYKHSTDSGITWEADMRLTSDSASSNYPSLAVSGSSVHVVWHDGRDGGSDVYYKRSIDGGTTWGADIALTNVHTANLPSLAVSGSHVHAVWDDARHGDMEIYYKRSTDDGTTWEADTRLTNDRNSQLFACVAVAGSNVHAVWGDDRDSPNTEIYYKGSTDGGTAWGPDTRLTNSPISFYPSIAASGLNVHLTWRDIRGGPRIYYKFSTDCGTNWSSDTALPEVNVIQLYPSIAVSDSMVHVVWWDQRDGPSGNVEIYYKRNPTGNNTGIRETSQLNTRDLEMSLKPIPNPFMDFTTIKGYEHEWFILYDILGQRRGIYKGERIGEGLAPGVYFLHFLRFDSYPIRIVKIK